LPVGRGGIMNKFQIGNIVDTNIQYYKGFNENVVAPQDLRWLKDLVVLKIDKISDTNTGVSLQNHIFILVWLNQVKHII